MPRHIPTILDTEKELLKQQLDKRYPITFLYEKEIEKSLIDGISAALALGEYSKTGYVLSSFLKETDSPLEKIYSSGLLTNLGCYFLFVRINGPKDLTLPPYDCNKRLDLVEDCFLKSDTTLAKLCLGYMYFTNTISESSRKNQPTEVKRKEMAFSYFQQALKDLDPLTDPKEKLDFLSDPEKNFILPYLKFMKEWMASCADEREQALQPKCCNFLFNFFKMAKNDPEYKQWQIKIQACEGWINALEPPQKDIINENEPLLNLNTRK